MQTRHYIDGRATRRGTHLRKRHDREYFRKELSENNSSAAVWKPVTVASPSETSVTRNEFVAKTNQFFYYDLDGNLTNDGRWTYTWDAENRLKRIVANSGVGPLIRMDFEYDWMSRRIAKKVWDNTAGTGSPTNSLKFVYDGWNLLATLSSQLSPLNCFMWGLDLSGSPQGAGGVGGLLAVSHRGTETNFVAFDGNGNVAGLVNASDGKSVAQYEYGPFGEVIRATGPACGTNPFRFSTKYQDDETDLLYYGYRYYNASTGRWLSRDPIEEDGGINFYAYVANLPNSSIDPLGLATHSGGAQALTPTDVNFGGKKIGSVQAWKNVGVDDGIEDAMWIELKKDPGCPECKWAQFVRNNHLDKNGAKRNFWAPVTMVRWRHSDEWYLDVLGRDGWMYRPRESSGSIEAIWDGPGEVKGNMTSPWVKSFMEFESILLCQIEVPCESGTELKWKPAFQVSWSLTQELPDWAKVYQASGKSITELPKLAAGPFWIAGYEYNNGVPDRKLPVLVRNPTFYLIMQWKDTLVTGGILVLLISGCLAPPDKGMRSPDSKTTRTSEGSLEADRQDAGDRWLDADSIESALQKQTKATDRSSQAFWDHYHELIALQKHADILIELPNQDRMEIRASKHKEFPKAQFPVSEMRKHLPSTRATNVAIDLVVVVMPDTFTAEQGKPSQLELMRSIDKLLRNAGVRRRVFETMGNGRFYKLDSSETN